MTKLGEGRCIVQKSRASSNFGILAPWVRTPKNVAFGYDVGKISAGCLVWYAFYDLRRGNGTGPILTAPEPTEG